jgi:hypothetical protein
VVTGSLSLQSETKEGFLCCRKIRKFVSEAGSGHAGHAVAIKRATSENNVTNDFMRKLTTHQQAVLIQVLLTFPHEPAGVLYAPAVEDARSYAEDFLTIFKAINWSVSDLETTDHLPVVRGQLAILVNEGKSPPSAEALRDALRIYGIEAEIIRDPAGLCAGRNFVLLVA